ncbi:hypothetical protein SAMN04488245_12329 [Alloyangia pacifica]|uniref:Xaa-Pro dipeptidyl-peptidase C-terminal domain-containing protein n=2 Tax=Alloyangia pacifica TaxID=311180 RepID=A0A1I6WFU2_9RHOB|nr:hypothetical protein SAMN04488245_12329 [Alloyangia pacifica]SFT24875.1 hypothetical protein SAMN04488050_12029 [Alloyangia pacifica]
MGRRMLDKLKDRKNLDGAWQISPDRYIAQRSCDFQLGAPVSQYVEMRDGCRLAVDIFLPERKDGMPGPERFPTITVFTPYRRRFKTKEGSTAEPSPNTAAYRDCFVKFGYAVVVIDCRGTGASFGTRSSFRSPEERLDTADVCDWIVAQEWSNGVIGSGGVSYLGAQADFLASTGHPAVKAIAPLFSVWDTYADNYFPGGIQLKALTKLYDDLMIGLDQDDREVLKAFKYWSDPDYIGAQPVDADPDGVLLAEALAEHRNNYRHTDFMSEFRFREEPLPYDADYSSASFSPYSYSGGTRSDVAIMSVSGWYDGFGYMNGAISRFLTLSDNPHHLLIGPWDHGARVDVSPWRQAVEPDFDILAEVLRFFDTYLLGMDTGLRDEAPVHYYAMHAEEWRSAAVWPPADTDHVLNLSVDNALSETAAVAGDDMYQVDFNIGTGNETRYERIAAVDSRDYYCDWQGRGDRMLSFTSAPLAAPSEIAGHVIAELWMQSSQPDAALFLYLTEVEADGTERYVTEALLRAIHRKVQEAPASYRTSWPFQSFRREDAAPLPVGEFEKLQLAFSPTAWRFSEGSRIRLSIAGADDDHCAQVPHGRPPLLTFARGEAMPSRIILPVKQ